MSRLYLTTFDSHGGRENHVIGPTKQTKQSSRMSSYGSINENSNSKFSNENNLPYRYPALVTLLSVIDEDPNESDYEDLDECSEIQRRRHSIQYELKKSWKLGLFLAILSGIFFTASSVMIQYFMVESMGIFLIRSVLQVTQKYFSLLVSF